MRRASYRILALQSCLLIARSGWISLIAALLVSGALFCWLSLIPHFQTKVESLRESVEQGEHTLHQAEETIPVLQQPLADVRAAAFYTRLGDKSRIEQQLKALFYLASKAGLVLHQADYKSAENKNGGFHTYRIQLPVIGSYRAVRQFCESVLLAIPHASLDEISFKRESVGSDKLEVKLRFTLYLSDKPKPLPDTTPKPKGVET